MTMKVLHHEGHKVPLHPDSADFARAIYVEETQRILRPQAQAAADQMQAAYIEAFYHKVTKWLDEYPRLTKGGVRNPNRAPLWVNFLEDNDPSTTPDGQAMIRGYIRDWLPDHPVIHRVVGFELNLALFKAAGWLEPEAVRKMRKPLREALAENGAFTQAEIRGLTHGKRALYRVITDAIGPLTLVNERDAIRGALMFVARYCPGPGPKTTETWPEALRLTNQTPAGDRARDMLKLHHTFYEEHHAYVAAKPYVDAFITKANADPVAAETSVGEKIKMG